VEKLLDTCASQVGRKEGIPPESKWSTGETEKTGLSGGMGWPVRSSFRRVAGEDPVSMESRLDCGGLTPRCEKLRLGLSFLY
jgi:hypothetical protein